MTGCKDEMANMALPIANCFAQVEEKFKRIKVALLEDDEIHYLSLDELDKLQEW